MKRNAELMNFNTIRKFLIVKLFIIKNAYFFDKLKKVKTLLKVELSKANVQKDSFLIVSKTSSCLIGFEGKLIIRIWTDVTELLKN